MITTTKVKINFGTQVALVIGIIAVVNFFTYQIFWRFDLTDGSVYTLSPVTRTTLNDLDDLVSVTAYFSADLPPQYANIRQEVTDVLRDYKNFGSGKFSFSFIDPMADENVQRELMFLGIPRVQFNVLENDKYQVVAGYVGLVIRYGDKYQAIPVVENVQNLEYELTSAIKKVTSEKTLTVGVATGHGEAGMDNEIKSLSESLRQLYDVRAVDLADGVLAPDDIDALILAGPTMTFSERERYVLDQFVMSGRGLLLLVDAVTTGDTLSAASNTTNAAEIVQSWGVDIQPNLVLDASSEMVSFNQGFTVYTTQYPFFVRVNPDGFNPDYAATARLQAVVLPWSSELQLSAAASSTVMALARSTTQAWLMNEPFHVAPDGSDYGFAPTGEQYVLAAGITGPVRSAFSAYLPRERESGTHQAATDRARVVVVGDSDFIRERTVQRFPDNLVFAQNIIDTLVLDENLASIRSKVITHRPLREVSVAKKQAIKYGNIFGVTALVLLLGTARYVWRRRRGAQLF